MTDLEMTKLCAEAMGFPNVRIEIACMGTRYVAYGPRSPASCSEFRPLHDDAQAMALVKKFWITLKTAGKTWDVEPLAPDPKPGKSYSVAYCQAEVTDLNRAIVECVAKMQQAKK